MDCEGGERSSPSSSTLSIVIVMNPLRVVGVRSERRGKAGLGDGLVGCGGNPTEVVSEDPLGGGPDPLRF